MPRFDVTTLGEGQLRYCIPAGTCIERVTQFDVYVSGTEANVTGLLSRLGWSCGWVSALPDTPLDQRVANEYRLAGLDLSAVVWTVSFDMDYRQNIWTPEEAAASEFDRRRP